MRLLVVLLVLILINSLCEGKRGAKHHRKHHKGKGHHLKKADHYGNRHSTDVGKLDVHRADGCSCPPDQVCVKGHSTGGGPVCVTADFLKDGRQLLKEFNNRHSEGFQLKDKEPKPHLFHKDHTNIHLSKPHNLHINIHSKKTEHVNHVIKSNHHKKGNKHGHKKISKQTSTCSTDSMSDMRQRLAGWFRLLHAQDRENHPHHGHHGHHGHHNNNKHSVKKELRLHHREGHCKCLKSVMWEMRHLDQNKDHQLNHTELKEIERNNMEPCLRPYLDSCDHNNDKKLSRNEWCCCFSEVLPPCYNELRNLREKLLTNPKDMILPKCDQEGFYAKEQCKGEHNKSKTCWCVDLNGNKVANTESKHRAHCGQLNVLGQPKVHH